MTPPDPARYAMDAAAAIGATYADLDNGGGYLFRISKGGRSVVAGAGAICCYPINSATAFTLSRDKAHTKSLLRDAGLPVADGGLFFAHTRRAGLREPGREVNDAAAFASRIGWPVFCKPNTGSRGNFAEVVADSYALVDYARRVADEFEAFLVEPVLQGAEHRVLIHDGRAIFHAAKAQPALIGDGVSSLSSLLAGLNHKLAQVGVSPYPASVLSLASLDSAHIPAPGVRAPLPGRRNLSAEGAIETFSPTTSPALAKLAADAVSALGLRLGAVDLFDTSPAGDLSQPVILEVNGNPGLRTLELNDRNDLIRTIWISMLTECLEP
jgi:glutathione synthase/RimK-type ligase-like ATP-grasp enzyme